MFLVFEQSSLHLISRSLAESSLLQVIYLSLFAEDLAYLYLAKGIYGYVQIIFCCIIIFASMNTLITVANFLLQKSVQIGFSRLHNLKLVEILFLLFQYQKLVSIT
jgi:hypothetical protein